MAPQTILEVFENRVNESSTRPALRRRVDGVWSPLSWKEWWEAAERVAAGLIDLGVEPGDRVALLSETRVEWLVCDIAIQMAGAVTVPVYPSLGPQLVGHILRDSEAVAVIAEDPMQLDKLLVQRDELPSVRHALWIEPDAVRPHGDFRGRISVRLEEILEATDPWNRSVDELAATGRRILADDARVVSRRRRAVRGEDLATIVYTSGTTGEPRGVMLTQGNLVAQVLALAELELFTTDDVQVLFLPLAHIFARVLYLAAIQYGIETAIPDGVHNLLADMHEVAPTFFAAVPQVFDQVRARLERDAGQDPVRERLFKVAERIGQSTEQARRSLRPDRLAGRLAHGVLDRLQPDRARRVFGGRVRFAISGGAALRPDTAEFFATFGLEVLEGYGLTETTAVATVNVPGDVRLGSVGRPVRGVDVTIDEDGEILVRGATVSPGYWRNEPATAASRDDDGWYRTGDLGQFDRDGYLSITGRKKELIVTAGGKNVAPVALEAALEGIAGVERAMVYGDGQPYVVALITLAGDIAVSPEAASLDEPLMEALSQAIDEVNKSGSAYAQVRRWAIVPRFVESRGELTPTGKLRRDVIAAQYADVLDGLYSAG